MDPKLLPAPNVFPVPNVLVPSVLLPNVGAALPKFGAPVPNVGAPVPNVFPVPKVFGANVPPPKPRKILNVFVA